MSRRKYWGYKHKNGSLHLKLFRSDAAVEEAYDSPLVEEVFDEFIADSPAEAFKKLKALADPNKGMEDEIADRIGGGL